MMASESGNQIGTLEYKRIDIRTGIGLQVALGGPVSAMPLMFLHGFPESARAWRYQLPILARNHRVAAPDQRGYGGSDKPQHVSAYRPRQLVDDIIALADALEWDRFVLVGHDWGGAVGWATALAHPDRLHGLVMVNAAHPYLFQKSIVEDAAQRRASQYINEFRADDMEARIRSMGIPAWFEMLFHDYIRTGLISDADRDAYLADWSQPGAIAGMLNWYKSSPIIVPAPDEEARLPWLDKAFPKVNVPTDVIWGTRDTALLENQLDELAKFVVDLRIIRIDAGHFTPWEAPEAVTSGILNFISRIA